MPGSCATSPPQLRGAAVDRGSGTCSRVLPARKFRSALMVRTCYIVWLQQNIVGVFGIRVCR